MAPALMTQILALVFMCKDHNSRNDLVFTPSVEYLHASPMHAA
jgi:hypothetical protein